jgi:hypothetical protein
MMDADQKKARARGVKTGISSMMSASGDYSSPDLSMKVSSLEKEVAELKVRSVLLVPCLGAHRANPSHPPIPLLRYSGAHQG